MLAEKPELFHQGSTGTANSGMDTKSVDSDEQHYQSNGHHKLQPANDVVDANGTVIKANGKSPSIVAATPIHQMKTLLRSRS